MSKLMEYIIALTNLYGIVHKDKVIEIYNKHNTDVANIKQVEELLAFPPRELNDAFVRTHEDYFVTETILQSDELNWTLESQANKPHYVPHKTDLLNYVDGNYFEKTRQYYALLHFVEVNFYQVNDEKAEWLCEDIQGLCHVGADTQVLLDVFNDRGVHIRSQHQLNEVMHLVMELSDNIRKWEHNGHTSNEIFELLGDQPNLRPLRDISFDYNATNVINMRTGEKIGRNDPCPCGSGKKFKKCCLG